MGLALGKTESEVLGMQPDEFARWAVFLKDYADAYSKGK